jgi:hypothetical protein
LKIQPDLWAEYASREVTRWEHLAELYRYLELSPFNRALQKTCIRHLYPHAMRTDRGFLLAEEMLSWLQLNKVIFLLLMLSSELWPKQQRLQTGGLFCAYCAA